MKTTLVIFGATGDLSRRKLLPALNHIVSRDHYQEVSILGVSRREIDANELVAELPALSGKLSMFAMNLEDGAEYERLKEQLKIEEGSQYLFYLAVPPNAATDIVRFLGKSGLNRPNMKVLLEKPFGFDLESAREMQAEIAAHFRDEQLYRIDHYMAKEVALELLRLRSDAENHHHAWDNQSVERIEILSTESIGIEGRANFYEQTGALRDFVQGHLMQLLSLVIMRPAAHSDLSDLPERRLEALSAVDPADPSRAIRAQYEGYQDEVENPGSRTETFVSLELSSGDARWAGVPLLLTSGKAVASKRAAITVRYKDGLCDTFEEGSVAFDGPLADAYERVLIEAIEGRHALFTTGEEVLESWRILAPIQANWQFDAGEIVRYERGASVEHIIANS